MATWTEPAVAITASSTAKVLAGNSQFGVAANNVTGLVVNKGGNGSSGVKRKKKTYYWHL